MRNGAGSPLAAVGPGTAAPAAPPRVTLKGAAIRLGGSALLLTLLFLLLPLDELWSAMRRVPAGLWFIALAVYMSFHLIGVFKWRLLVNTAGAGLDTLGAVRAYYLGLFGNTFLPSVVGGDVLRAGVAMRRVRSGEALVLGSLVDRIQDVLGLAAVAGIGALLLPAALDERSRRIFWTLAAVFAALAAIAVLLVLLLPGRRFPWRIRRRLVRIRAAFRGLSRRPRALATAFILGMLLQTLQVALNVWLGGMVGLDAPFQVWLFVWPLAKIAATVPVTQGGLGVREAALAALFAPFGVPAVLAVAVSLVFQVVVISGGLLGGALSLLLGRADGARQHRGLSTAGPAPALDRSIR